MIVLLNDHGIHMKRFCEIIRIFLILSIYDAIVEKILDTVSQKLTIPVSY